MVTIVDVPVARCGQCGEEILQRPQDIEDFIAQKKEADMAVGFLDKLYFSNRWLFYLVGLISLALLAVAVYIFFKG